MKVTKQITKDLSPTLYVHELDEHYHSIYGAIQESLHVFINAGLNQIKKDDIKILEIGFGTGLNALLTISENKSNDKTIYYETIEKYPLDSEIIKQIAFNDYSKDLFNKIHNSEWEKEININENFILKKVKKDLLDYKTNKKFDLIYFDAFAPEKQPELWTEHIFKMLYNASNTDCILVTYSAKGIVKQALRNAGYDVKRLVGPKGKRHMVRAIKL